MRLSRSTIGFSYKIQITLVMEKCIVETILCCEENLKRNIKNDGTTIFKWITPSTVYEMFNESMHGFVCIHDMK